MSSAYSTITSNVNLLLVNSATITNFNPYIAYVSSVSVPGRIATVRDATGLVSSPGRLIILSTLKDVRFSDGTSSITISQPFGYISLSSRDKNTWDIINTFAFPMPSPVSYVSSIYATDQINADKYLARSYVSTNLLTTDSISSFRIQALTVSTANLFSQNVSSQNLRSFNNVLTNVSTQTLSTVNLFSQTVSTTFTSSRNVQVSSITLSNVVGSASLTLSNDNQALLVNGVPTGTFRAISTATATLNMNSNSISNVLTVSTLNLTASNIVVQSLSSFNLQTQNLSTNNLFANSLSTVNMRATTLSTITLNSSNILNQTRITTSNIFLSNILFNDGCNNDTFSYVTPFVDINTSNHRFLAYSNSIETNYIASDWSYFKAKNGIDISNNTISNISQATFLNSVQTTITMPVSFLVTTSNSEIINSNTDLDLFTEFTVNPFTFVNTGFINTKFLICFHGITLCNTNTGTNGYYCYLSNRTQSQVVNGRTFNDLGKFLFLQNENPIYPDRTAFSFSDIFNTSGWNTGDEIFVLLHVFNSGSQTYFFSNVNFSVTYEPLFL